MTGTKTLKKLDYPHKITLYKNGDNPSIYYYFSWKNKVYRGSTSETDLKLSINKVVDIFTDVKKGLRNKVKQEKPIYLVHPTKAYLAS